MDGDLPDREIRQGYCFVIREVSRTFVTKYGRWYSTGVRCCHDMKDSYPAWKQAGIDIHIVRSLNVLE